MTTRSITARNVNVAASEALHWLSVAGRREASRNGPVLVAPGPVVIEYLRPQERVLFATNRHANPYLHLMEALWMLAGRDDVTWPALFSRQFLEYTDDGETLHGAYGARWRNWFAEDDGMTPLDQLGRIVQMLREKPDSRRCVLAMWDASNDLGADSRDLPCNTHAYVDRRGDALNLTVMNRSNDAIWGCFGANVVHFSVLQEYLAAWLGVPMGAYVHFTSNLHAYVERPEFAALVPGIDVHDLYAGDVIPFPLVAAGHGIPSWDEDLRKFLSDPCGDAAFTDPFFNRVAAPMYASWHDRKQKRNNGALALSDSRASLPYCDWLVAARRWIVEADRRLAARGETR